MVINKVSHNQFTKKERLKPLVKWAGGKAQELKYILPELPEFDNYYEPFVGGGAVYTAIKANQYFINDKSNELVDLYKIIISPQRKRFFKALENLIKSWDKLKRILAKSNKKLLKTYKAFSKGTLSAEKLQEVINDFILENGAAFQKLFFKIYKPSSENFLTELYINLFRKSNRMKKLEMTKGNLPDKDILDNIESAVKSAFYMHVRYLYNRYDVEKYNSTLYTVFFLFIRNYAYGGMFRYNRKGEFNVPYGGIGYNNKNFLKKITYLQSEALRQNLEKTIIENKDFETFLKDNAPTQNDFIFLDPPYDTEFKTYAKNDFTQADHQRLANYLVHECPAKWMMVIKNTDFIYNLYQYPNIDITTFDKTYLISFMNRNDKDVKHLIIKNY